MEFLKHIALFDTYLWFCATFFFFRSDNYTFVGGFFPSSIFFLKINTFTNQLEQMLYCCRKVTCTITPKPWNIVVKGILNRTHSDKIYVT